MDCLMQIWPNERSKPKAPRATVMKEDPGRAREGHPEFCTHFVMKSMLHVDPVFMHLAKGFPRWK